LLQRGKRSGVFCSEDSVMGLNLD